MVGYYSVFEYFTRLQLIFGLGGSLCMLAIPIILFIPLCKAGYFPGKVDRHTRFESSASFDCFTLIVWISVICFGVGFWWVVTKVVLAVMV